MKYMTMCGDVRIKIIPVINIEDIEMSSIAYKEVQKLVTYTFGLLDCIIEKDEMGKPFFQKHIDYDLSISHTDGLVAVAVGKNHKIGIDVEKIHIWLTNILNMQKRHVNIFIWICHHMKNIREMIFLEWLCVLRVDVIYLCLRI